MNWKTSKRSGFTLIELLVVIAIIAILIALLLPAVQQAREAARRATCKNKIKQVGLALHNYHDAHKVFPPAGITYGWCTLGTPDPGRTTHNKNGLSLLLPYVDQAPLYNNINQDTANGAQNTGYCCSYAGAGAPLAGNPADNAAEMTTLLDVYLCPSDSGTTHLGTGAPYGTSVAPGPAKTNYELSADQTVSCNYWASQGVTARKMFGENSKCKISDVKDGTSNTIMVCETTRTVANGEPPAWGMRGWVTTGGDVDPGINVWDIPTGWTRGDVGNLNSWGQVGSLHTGGAHFGMGDGAVRFFSENTDLTLLRRLGTISDGSVVEVP
ncbi:DUF1559 domain-containing protein [Gimesia sp.]|uniref:DUF1559 domain-containing protein n=1 Tax=Gimesia sp. TaxID=2024833 RepID=UPI000C352717|nr:DUF1559 domain-containing protein [Gimesia sp.]MAX35527.1 prepilin-type cleavage/methylation domain-containing protein [Gimesia sp.]HBL42683.1 prepilin-type cleavage/methylation domain-containing protein [Planctomycetaceae bacterium]